MTTIQIFATDPQVESFEDLVLGETRYVFERLDGTGPTVLVEHGCWLFVDWMLPELSGLELCRRLRADPRTADAHLTMVLEADEADDRRRALRAGADDYMLGPVTRNGMLDRILAQDPARGHRSAPAPIRVGPLVVNPAAERACWGETVIDLSPNEFRLLRFIAENPNRVLSRRELIQSLGKAGDPDYLRTVDVWIKRLRSALRQAGAGPVLRTVTNKGYVFDAVDA